MMCRRIFFLLVACLCAICAAPASAQTLNTRAAADYSAVNSGRAVVIMQRGQIVFEEYQNGYNSATPHPLFSGTKSFSCALAVAAQDEGLVSLDEPVANVVSPWRVGNANAAPQVDWKSLITGRQLLSLSSGLSTDFSPGSDLTTMNSYQASLFNRSAAAPGAAGIYTPSTFQAFGAFFELKTGGQLTATGTVSGGRDPLDYLKARVFDRIGMKIGAWTRDANGKPTLSSGASLTAREWIKYGQLVLQGGKWNGETILNESRLRECSTYNNAAFAGYGLAWWLNRPIADTYAAGIDLLPTADVNVVGRIAADVPPDMFMAAGAFNQRLYIIPSLELVIVHFAGGGTWSDNEFLKRLLGTTNVPAQPFDYQDIWWAGVQENGWGMTITQQGSTLFPVFYIYDAAGQPQWVAMPGGTWNATLSSYTGALYIPSGSPYSAYDTTRFNANAAVGSATLNFRDAGSAVVNYTINGVSGVKSISRLAFADGAPRKNYSDIWWGGVAQNGWGISLTQQANVLFAVWYTYDAQGRPYWYVMSGGNFTADKTYTGQLYRASGSPWLGTTYNSAAFRTVPVGTLTLNFSDLNNATMRYTIDGFSGTNTITRNLFGITSAASQ
jgi:CubicO group peptidase (beta-lactamase class C family)